MKPQNERKPPSVQLTNTALDKAAAKCPAVAAMSRQERIDWLRNAIAWSEVLDPSTTHEDMERALLLPAEWLTDLGDRLVAVCASDKHSPGSYVVTTVKERRACMRVEKRGQEDRALPAAPAPVLAVVRDLAPTTVPVAPVSTRPDPVVSADPSARVDNRGAQMLRIEMARRNIKQTEAAALVGCGASTICTLINAKSKPNGPLKVALAAVYGIPASAWGEPC